MVSHFLRSAVVALLLCTSTMASFAREPLVLSATDGRVLTGISARVLYEAFSLAGLSLMICKYPAQRALLEANTGRVDGALHRIAGLDATFSRLLRVPVAINQLEPVAVTRDDTLAIGDWSDLSEHRIGIVRGVVVLEQRTAGMDVQRVNDSEQLLRMLVRSRFDVALLDRLEAEHLLWAMPGTILQVADAPLETLPLYLYLHESHADLLPALESALLQLRSAGRIAAIRQQELQGLVRDGRLSPIPVPVCTAPMTWH